jgi:tetratricopeptide (TPR) repeat protein
MFVRARTHSSIEVFKWVALIVIAGALALLAVSTVHGVEATRPPGLLPPIPDSTPLDPPQQPMTQLPEFDEQDPYALSLEIWRAIDAHEDGNLQTAITVWEQLRLPPQADVWRRIVLGVAYLQNGEIDRAETLLLEVRREHPQNAVAHYATALVDLIRAETAAEWYDAANWDVMRMAAYPPDAAPLPKTRSLYNLSAIMALRKAVVLADAVPLDQPVLAGEWVTSADQPMAMPVAVPRVRDLLATFSGDDFEARSHVALGRLYLDRSALHQAERHLDRAADMGQPTWRLLCDLSDRYEADGDYGAAMRAHLKAASRGGGVACLIDSVEDLGQALFVK